MSQSDLLLSIGTAEFRVLLAFEIQLNPICRPSSDTAAKEILILGPDWKVQEQSYGNNRPIGSFTPARAPLLEVLEDFLFGDSFGGKSRLQPRGCFLERGAIGLRALAPRRNVVADRIPVARNRYRHVALKEIVGEFFSKFSNADLERFHYGLLCTYVYTIVPLIDFIPQETLFVILVPFSQAISCDILSH
jgi:hypothetical protein